jgi:predicted transcriptional regulator
MNVKIRQIEVEAATAEALEARAAELGISVSELLADLVSFDRPMPADLEALRATGRGPWAPEILAEDARRLADFERTGEGVPWDEVHTWMQSWGTPGELPAPKPRKL